MWVFRVFFIMVPSPLTASRRLQRQRAADNRRRRACASQPLPLNLEERISVTYEQALLRRGVLSPPGLSKAFMAIADIGHLPCISRVPSAGATRTSALPPSIDITSDGGFADVASDDWEEARTLACDAVRSLRIFSPDITAMELDAPATDFVTQDVLASALSTLRRDLFNEVASSCTGLARL